MNKTQKQEKYQLEVKCTQIKMHESVHVLSLKWVCVIVQRFIYPQSGLRLPVDVWPPLCLSLQVKKYLSCSSLKKDIGLQWHSLTVFLCTALFVNASAGVLLSSGLAVRRLLGSRSDPKLWLKARRVACSVAAVALAYILCFVPYHVVRTPYTLTQTKVITDCQTKRRLFLGKEWTLLLTVLHLCFDPLLFFYLCTPFRQTVSKLLCCITQQAAGDPEEEAADEMKQTMTASQQEDEVSSQINNMWTHGSVSKNRRQWGKLQKYTKENFKEELRRSWMWLEAGWKLKYMFHQLQTWIKKKKLFYAQMKVTD